MLDFFSYTAVYTAARASGKTLGDPVYMYGVIRDLHILAHRIVSRSLLGCSWDGQVATVMLCLSNQPGMQLGVRVL